MKEIEQRLVSFDQLVKSCGGGTQKSNKSRGAFESFRRQRDETTGTRKWEAKRYGTRINAVGSSTGTVVLERQSTTSSSSNSGSRGRCGGALSDSNANERGARHPWIPLALSQLASHTCRDNPMPNAKCQMPLRYAALRCAALALALALTLVLANVGIGLKISRVFALPLLVSLFLTTFPSSRYQDMTWKRNWEGMIAAVIESSAACRG